MYIFLNLSLATWYRFSADWHLESPMPPFFRHKEVPRLGVGSELQLQVYATATSYWILATSVTYAAAWGNAGSLTHWTRPGIKPASSWILCWILRWGFLFVCLCFVLLRLHPPAHGSSQARGLIRAAAAGLHQSHSKARSEPRLQPTPQLTAMPDPQCWILNPLSKARDRTHSLVVPSRIHFLCAKTGTPMLDF